jgi:hypothetical protein
MLKGYTAPLPPPGKAYMVAAPSWHDSGDLAGEEMHMLAPVWVGPGVRRSMSYPVTDPRTLEQGA